MDPFNLSRDMVTDFELKVKGSPFYGLVMSDLLRFMKNVHDDFILHYPELSCKPSKPTNKD